MPIRSRRRIFRRRKASSMRLVGVLTLAFAGSFAVVIAIGWQGGLQAEAPRGLAGTTLPETDGLMAHMPAMRVAASSPSVPDRR